MSKIKRRVLRHPLLGARALPRPLICVLTKEGLLKAQRSSGTQAESPTPTDCNRQREN